MRARVFSGDSGRMSSRRPPQGHVLPVSTKMYKELFRVSRPEGQIDGYSRDLNLWSFEGALYRLQYTEWDKHHFLLADPTQRDFVARGRRWLLSEGRLALADRTISTEFPFPVPNILATKVDPWVKSWAETGRADDAPIADLAECSGGLLFDKWGWLPLPLYHVEPNREYYELLAYIQFLYSNNSPHVEAFMARLKDIPKEEVTEISNAQQLYTVSYYDTFPGRTEEMFELSSRGGAWIENGKLYSNGEFTVGEAFLIPTVFQADGTCWGVSLVNSGALSVPTPSHFIPKPGGVSVVSWRDGEGRGELIGCGLPRHEVEWSAEVKGPDGKTQNVMLIDEFTVGQLGTTEGEQFISRTFPHFGMARSFFMEPELVRAWLPPVNGEPERIEGGRCRTIEEWCASEAGSIQGAAGPFLIDEEADHTNLIDFRTLRRHILPGQFVDIPERVDGAWAKSVRVTDTEIVAEESPLAHVECVAPFSHSIKPEHVIAPWRASIGQPLEIGWWDFPSIGLRGSPPNVARLEWAKENSHDPYVSAADDHHWGDIYWHRTSISLTSDGYVQGSVDISNTTPNTIKAFGFKFNGEEWESGYTDFTVTDTRVAPLGQGCYGTYHFPGEDWSIFHAPVGFVHYQRMFEATDYSSLLPLTGLAGGFALANAIHVEQVIQKYYEDSLGNLMLIYTVPRQLLTIMSPMMDEVLFEVAREDRHFWTFAGWGMVRGSPHGIFSKVPYAAGWGVIPEVWGLGRNGLIRIDASEAGEVGERASGLIPSTYYPRFGLYPGGSGAPTGGWELIFPDEYYTYSLPELPQEADTEQARDFLERMQLWEERAQHVNTSRVVIGSSTNHQILDSAVIDPSLQLIDLRLQREDDGVLWVMLQHESGIWFSIRTDAEVEHYLFESKTDEWYLVSAGTTADGSVMALFGWGVLDMDDWRTFDNVLYFYFRMGHAHQRQALWKWPARLMPVVIAQNAGELQKLASLIKKEEE